MNLIPTKLTCDIINEVTQLTMLSYIEFFIILNKDWYREWLTLVDIWPSSKWPTSLNRSRSTIQICRRCTISTFWESCVGDINPCHGRQ